MENEIIFFAVASIGIICTLYFLALILIGKSQKEANIAINKKGGVGMKFLS
jgi:hypothetical protein